MHVKFLCTYVTNITNMIPEATVDNGVRACLKKHAVTKSLLKWFSCECKLELSRFYTLLEKGQVILNKKFVMTSFCSLST